MKNIEVEFEPGQEVFILKNNVQVQTRIRAYNCSGALEIGRDSKGVRTERIVESTTYSTLADPNKSLKPNQIGATKDDLIQKLFGRSVAAPKVDLKEDEIQPAGDQGSEDEQ
jgi:hypothetical protein